MGHRVKRQRSEGGRKRSEGKRQMRFAVGGWRSATLEVGGKGQKAEVGGQKSEVGSRRSEALRGWRLEERPCGP
jgi:hypothetical protein